MKSDQKGKEAAPKEVKSDQKDKEVAPNEGKSDQKGKEAAPKEVKSAPKGQDPAQNPLNKISSTRIKLAKSYKRSFRSKIVNEIRKMFGKCAYIT